MLSSIPTVIGPSGIGNSAESLGQPGDKTPLFLPQRRFQALGHLNVSWRTVLMANAASSGRKSLRALTVRAYEASEAHFDSIKRSSGATDAVGGPQRRTRRSFAAGRGSARGVDWQLERAKQGAERAVCIVLGLERGTAIQTLGAGFQIPFDLLLQQLFLDAREELFRFGEGSSRDAQCGGSPCSKRRCQSQSLRSHHRWIGRVGVSQQDRAPPGRMGG